MTHTVRSKARIALFSFVLILGFAPCAYANLVMQPSTLPELNALLFALFTEAAFLALILIPHGFRWVRVFFAWLLVTTVTWTVLIFPILQSFKYLIQLTFPTIPIVIIGGEVIVVIAEGLILKYVSTKRFFTTDSAKPFPFYSAFGYSLLANIVSIVAGVAFFILQWWFTAPSQPIQFG